MILVFTAITMYVAVQLMFQREEDRRAIITMLVGGILIGSSIGVCLYKQVQLPLAVWLALVWFIFYIIRGY